MKLAWLVWAYEETQGPDIHFSEPNGWAFKVVPIVYAEILP